MIYYKYHPQTKEFSGEGCAQKDPLNKDNFLLPANATWEKPLDCNKNEINLFIKNVWKKLPDYRGTIVYNKVSGNQEVILRLGEISDEYTLTPPPSPAKYHRWNETEWIVDADKKQEIIALLEARIDKHTDETILNGFVYDGNSYYLSLENQINFKGLNDIRETLTYPVKIKHQNGYAMIASAIDYHQFYLAGLGFKQLTIESGWAAKDALQDKTTTELIELLKQGE